MIKSSAYFAKERYEDRNMAWGVREHNMCAASSGMMLHGGLRPFAATFFVFTDYARPAIRLACIMKLPVIYVMTHDSIGLGEDGTTHQPIEHLASLRAMPRLHIIRPADANEAAYAWRAAIRRMDGPTMLVLTRQKLPIFDSGKVAHAQNLYKGAYILSAEKKGKLDVILIATGSEVHLILDAQKRLEKSGINARVVSMPSWELFREQAPKYRESVLPAKIKARVSIEAASSMGWREWVGEEGKIIGIDTFGASAPDKDLFEHFGITVDNVVNTVKKLVKRKS
jgi:transketolase